VRGVTGGGEEKFWFAEFIKRRTKAEICPRLFMEEIEEATAEDD
jgi:hypothetical protein